MTHRCNLVVVRTLSKELVNGSFARYLCSKPEIEKVACREGKTEIEGERESGGGGGGETDRQRQTETDRQRAGGEREGGGGGGGGLESYFKDNGIRLLDSDMLILESPYRKSFMTPRRR